MYLNIQLEFKDRSRADNSMQCSNNKTLYYDQTLY